MLTAGGDVSAEGTHDILLGQDVDQAFVVLVRNEVTALRINALLKHVVDLTEVGSHGLKQGFLVLIGSTTGLGGLVSIGLHGLAGEGLGRGLAEFRFDLLTTLHAMDAICELCDLGFHILIGLVVFGRKSALVGGVGVEEGVHHTHELVALFTHLSNSHRKLPPLNEFFDGVQLLLELCHGAALGLIRLGRSCIDPAFLRNLSHQGVHYGYLREHHGDRRLGVIVGYLLTGEHIVYEAELHSLVCVHPRFGIHQMGDLRTGETGLDFVGVHNAFFDFGEHFDCLFHLGLVAHSDGHGVVDHHHGHRRHQHFGTGHSNDGRR